MKLTKNARAALAAQYDIDEDYVVNSAIDALTRPGSAYFHDSELYDTHTLAMYASRDDYSLIDQSNLSVALSELARYGAEPASIGHFAAGQVDCLKIRVVNANGMIVRAFVELCKLARAIEEYPILDENDYSERQMRMIDNAIDECMRTCTSDDERESKDLDRVFLPERLQADAIQYVAEQAYDGDPADFWPENPDVWMDAVKYAEQIAGDTPTYLVWIESEVSGEFTSMQAASDRVDVLRATHPDLDISMTVTLNKVDA